MTQLEGTDAAKTDCEAGFQVFLKSALEYMTRVSRSQGDQSQRVTVKFNKALLTRTYEVFDKVRAISAITLLLS